MRVAFIGNSHLLAYKDAEPQIRARFPGIELSFFGIRNQDFFQNAVRNLDGLWYHPEEAQNGSVMVDQNGSAKIDFQSFDHVFLTSHGFYLGGLLEVLASYDILDLRPAGHDRLISWPCVLQLLEARLQHYAKRLRAFFPLERKVTIVQMPFPAEQALRSHPHLGQAVEQPDIEMIFSKYNALICTSLEGLSCGYQPVPPELLHQPFVTEACYARSEELAFKGDVKDSDQTHMNSSFALRMTTRLLTA